MRYLATGLAALLMLGSVGTAKAIDQQAKLEKEFQAIVRPFLRKNCLGCHGKQKQEAKLDLSTFGRVAQVTQGFARQMVKRGSGKIIMVRVIQGGWIERGQWEPSSRRGFPLPESQA